MNVPIELDDEQINWVPYDKQGQITIYRPIKQFYDPIRKMNRYLVPFQDPKTGNVVRVQDQMIEHIVMANKWKYPIYFATSVPGSNRWTLSDYTIRKGMALQIVSEKSTDNMDPITTENFLYNLYRYRGVSDLNIYKDENNVGLPRLIRNGSWNWPNITPITAIHQKPRPYTGTASPNSPTITRAI
jgi:hypothetical protein